MSNSYYQSIDHNAGNGYHTAGNYGSQTDNGFQDGYGYGFSPDIGTRASSKRSKCMIISAVVGLLVIIGVAVGVGVGVSRAKHSSSSSSSTALQQTDPNDPSTFVRDQNLKQSFYGIAYTPDGAIMPDCGANLQNVIKDVQLLSQLTTRLRLYGADCNQSALVLEAIKQTKTNVTLWLGNYVAPNDDASYQRQKSALQSAIQTYGTDHISGITVGNEYMLNYLNSQGSNDPNSATGEQGAKQLISYIQDTRTMLQQMNLPKSIQVGNADAGSFFNKDVLSAVDYGMSNVHPWFANVSIDQAADWTYSFFQTTNVQVAQSLPNQPKMYIAETGWPSKSSDTANESNGPSTASTDNLQKFINTFVCQSNTNGTGYFYFEAFDEPWKDKQYGGVEGWWGLFGSDRKFKSLTVPDCPSP